MMGLGNGRRGMKSPPLLVAALLACVIVLGFNYWIASSRSVNLQTQILELEGRVRRAAAERGAVELKKNEFQGELEKQREQLDRIQSRHNFQMENVNKMYQDEKALLVNNITESEKLIRNLKEHLQDLQKNYGKLQQDILQFQKNQSNLERKFSYDLNQCINQMKELKEQCEERIEEITKKGSEAIASRNLSEKNILNNLQTAINQPEPKQRESERKEVGVQQEKGNIVPEGPISPSEKTPSMMRQEEKGEETSDILTPSQEQAQRENQGGELLPPEPVREQNSNKKGKEKESAELGGSVQIQKGPGGLLVSQENHEADEPERDELIVREDEQGKQDGAQDGAKDGVNQPKSGISEDYNDENEAESERDKQAALAGNDNNLSEPDVEEQNKDNINDNLVEEREKRDQTK
ncbi:Golgi membrane protein 1-like [Vombatus ursinus]|uniref:Golgi membrane protein 1 n=1 Tax=Vombatus ursinus TaxID=29139 RepID=A0A4X2LKN6_VOMUR|nr:Golgi membrane protein 1-like [Vombatus ursinus]XP_027695369.1 Golgi membrane protein 1-like [Vombatus ursinus]XP_027695391.1 Golgi membrane protein 1-like [Vombatus ursinus]XP_027695392.1 Golgi membrane protein 1-like [Vombatus ursinus]